MSPVRFTYNMSMLQTLPFFIWDNSLLLLAALPVATILYLLTAYFVDPHGLRSYPGPFLAKFTDLWIAWTVHSNRWSLSVEDAHKKYGTHSFGFPIATSLTIAQVPSFASPRTTSLFPTRRRWLWFTGIPPDS